MVSFIITLLFLLTLTGMTFVPDSVIPIMIWPLLLGIGNLVFILINRFRHQFDPDEEMAPLLTAVFSLTLAVAIPFEHPRRGVSFLIAFAITFLAGVIWSAWRATSNPNGSNRFRH